VNHLDTYG